jgi:hypothetical protein
MMRLPIASAWCSCRPNRSSDPGTRSILAQTKVQGISDAAAIAAAATTNAMQTTRLVLKSFNLISTEDKTDLIRVNSSAWPRLTFPFSQEACSHIEMVSSFRVRSPAGQIENSDINLPPDVVGIQEADHLPVRRRWSRRPRILGLIRSRCRERCPVGGAFQAILVHVAHGGHSHRMLLGHLCLETFDEPHHFVLPLAGVATTFVTDFVEDVVEVVDGLSNPGCVLLVRCSIGAAQIA